MPETGQWALPSGQTLAEFALRSGLAAPALLWRPLSPAFSPRGTARDRKLREVL